MKIKVCGIQFQAVTGEYFNNRQRAEALIREAANKGSKIILLPELALTGYIYETSIWDYAEPLNGHTAQWLLSLSEELNVHIGTCIIEKSGDDFFDTFILTGPDHALYHHRKVEAASFEACYLKSAGINNSVFDTAIGRIGVGICFDLNKQYVMDDLIKQKPEILLTPFCYPTLPSWFSSLSQRINWDSKYRLLPKKYAVALKCPVVAATHTGLLTGTVPGLRMVLNKVLFVDNTQIIDQSGKELDSVNLVEGLAISEVELANSNRSLLGNGDNNKDKWVSSYTFMNKFFANSSQFFGKIAYKLNSNLRKCHENKKSFVINTKAGGMSATIVNSMQKTAEEYAPKKHIIEAGFTQSNDDNTTQHLPPVHIIDIGYASAGLINMLQIPKKNVRVINRD